MMRGILDFLRGGVDIPPTVQRQKLLLEGGPDHIYAVGDVHGCDDLLGRLEDLIFEDSRKRPGTKWLIMLGDYVDRGPKSASVLDRLMTKPRADVKRFCLAGNHEEVMLDFLRNPSSGSSLAGLRGAGDALFLWPSQVAGQSPGPEEPAAIPHSGRARRFSRIRAIHAEHTGILLCPRRPSGRVWPLPSSRMRTCCGYVLQRTRKP